MRSQKLLSLGAAAVAVTSIAAGSLLFRDGSDSTASALGLSDSQVEQIALNVANTAEADRDAYLQKIADNLGVDLAKLKEAIGKANTATLDEKVADGSMTRERADAMREKLASGDSFFFGGKGGHGGPGGHSGPDGHRDHGTGAEGAAVAGFLGIDEATLRTELETKSLATVATEHGKSTDELKAFLTSEKQADLAERVAAGDLTQAEADEKLAEFQERIDEEINEVHTPRGEGERSAHMGGQAPAAPAQ